MSATEPTVGEGARTGPRPGLVRLALRRTLTWPLLALHLALVLLAATRRWVPESTPFAGDAATVSAASAHMRQGVWLVLAAFALPLLVVRAAGTGERWRRRDADWLGALPLGRASLLAHTWLGTLAGALVLVAATALAAEAAARDPRPAMRWERTLDHPPLVLQPGDPAGAIELGPGALAGLPSGTRLRVEVTVAPGSGPAVTVAASLLPAGSTESTPGTVVRVHGRTRLELALPDAVLAGDPGNRRATLVLARRSEGAVLVLPRRSIDAVAPARAHALASWELGRETLLASAVWIVLAIALGVWMRPAYAAGLTACLALASWRWLAGVSLVPGASLARDWTLVGQGLVPPVGSWGSFAGALVAVTAGVAVARRGLDRGRSLAP